MFHRDMHCRSPAVQMRLRSRLSQIESATRRGLRLFRLARGTVYQVRIGHLLWDLYVLWRRAAALRNVTCVPVVIRAAVQARWTNPAMLIGSHVPRHLLRCTFMFHFEDQAFHRSRPRHPIRHYRLRWQDLRRSFCRGVADVLLCNAVFCYCVSVSQSHHSPCWMLLLSL